MSLCVVLLLCGCGAPQRVDKESFAMGTVVTVSVYNTRHAQYSEDCFALISALEAETSVNLPNSAISRLNESGQARFEGDVAAILRAAMRVGEDSDGAFNVAVLPLQKLWDVQNRSAADPLPTQEEIDTARLLSTGGVEMSEDGDAVLVELQPGRGLDLGGIAKGYAGDRCAELLREKKVDNALINIGGNVRTLGNREFRVGLRNPRGSGLYGLVTVGECNVITSGDYERYFEAGGLRYHHIFDPATGEPARSGLMSATAIGPDGAIADGLSTAIFVLGQEEGLALAERMGYQAIVVTGDYEVYCTEGIWPAVEITDDRFRLAGQGAP